MFEYDDSNCYVGGDDSSSQIRTNTEILRKKIEEISQTTSANTPFYKVLYPSDINEQVQQYRTVAKEIRENFSDLIVISMGGAALNPQSMLKLISGKSAINIHFLDNTDPVFFKNLIESVSLKDTAFLVISNSVETLTALFIELLLLSMLKSISMLLKSAADMRVSQI